MTVVRPPRVADGATIAVVAPAGPVLASDLEAGVSTLGNRYKVLVNDATTDRAGFLAGDDETRRGALQDAIDDDRIEAVLAARGGYGTTRILDGLDLGRLGTRPKWVVGSSDLTALLLRLWTDANLMSIHGPMPSRFVHGAGEDLRALFDLLSGGEWAGAKLSSLRTGTARGPMLGGNLTILAHLCGSISPQFARGAILFLEDVGEQPYRIDRCLVQLARAEILSSVAGIVLGDFTNCPPGPDGVSVWEVLGDHLNSLGIPVAGGYPAAHGKRNSPFVHGMEVILEVARDGGVIRPSGLTR